MVTRVEPVLPETSKGRELGTVVDDSQEPLPLRISIIFILARSSALVMVGRTSLPETRPRPTIPLPLPTMVVTAKRTLLPESDILCTI